MRKLSMLFLLALAATYCSGQTLPFLEDGKVWEVYDPCGGKAHYKTFRIDGDTVINGRYIRDRSFDSYQGLVI